MYDVRRFTCKCMYVYTYERETKVAGYKLTFAYILPFSVFLTFSLGYDAVGMVIFFSRFSVDLAGVFLSSSFLTLRTFYIQSVRSLNYFAVIFT